MIPFERLAGIFVGNPIETAASQVEAAVSSSTDMDPVNILLLLRDADVPTIRAALKRRCFEFSEHVFDRMAESLG